MENCVDMFLANSLKKKRVLKGNHGLKAKLREEMQFLEFGLFEDGSKGGFYVPVDDRYGVKISSINEGLFEIGLFARMFNGEFKGDSPSFAVVLDVDQRNDTMIYMLDNLGNNLQKVNGDLISSSGLLRKLNELSDSGLEFSSQDIPVLASGYHVDLSGSAPRFVLTNTLISFFENSADLFILDAMGSELDMTNPVCIGEKFVSGKRYQFKLKYR